MKNYYYFLGIEKDASLDEIRRAYRKLSLKYHPDRNSNDEFFSKRFREAQEAYEILSSEDKRKQYDENFSSEIIPIRNTNSPIIKSFKSTLSEAKKGDVVTIKWHTQHANVVKLIPFGLIKSFGEKSFRITEFKEGKFVVLLHATNSIIKKTVVNSITIHEVKESNKEILKESFNELLKSSNSDSSKKEYTNIAKLIFALLILVIGIICIALFVTQY